MGSPSSIDNDQASVVRLLHEYYSAFSTFNVKAVLPFFHEPALLIGPQGVFAATTHSLLAAALNWRQRLAPLWKGFGPEDLVEPS